MLGEEAAAHVKIGSQHSREMLDALAAAVPQERLPAQYCGAHEGPLQGLPEEQGLWALVAAAQPNGH